MKQTPKVLANAVVLALATTAYSGSAMADNIITDGKFKADFRLRYETVEQDNALKDADALTLRTRLTYTTGSINGFSALFELENVANSLGVDDYSVPPSGFNTGEYSVIADPKTTELDQAYVQYRADDTLVRVGRQVIALDNQRFVGHVGWRQDRQTFDAVGINLKPLEGLNLKYYYIDKRNRIFADDADIDSKDHIINLSTTTALGTFTGYAYFLEVDNGIPNSLDTAGFSLVGKHLLSKAKANYRLEYANQISETAGNEYAAEYWLFEAGLGYQDYKFTFGYEVLGSDNGNYGFATPLATLHKFNGWIDNFLATPDQGLQDLYLKLAGKFAGGNYAIHYHSFSADESASDVSDLGSEINLQYTRKINEHFMFGVKYATYDAGDIKVDADKIAIWIGAKF